MFFDNEGWTILLKWYTIYFLRCVAIKIDFFVDVIIKYPVDLPNICYGTYKDKKRNSIGTLSKLLTCVFSYFGRSSS